MDIEEAKILKNENLVIPKRNLKLLNSFINELSFIAKRGVIQSDTNSTNMLITSDDEIFLIDFSNTYNNCPKEYSPIPINKVRIGMDYKWCVRKMLGLLDLDFEKLELQTYWLLWPLLEEEPCHLENLMAIYSHLNKKE